MPKRSWLVLPSLLLPKSIAINATIRLGVKGPLSSGKVRRKGLDTGLCLSNAAVMFLAKP